MIFIDGLVEIKGGSIVGDKNGQNLIPPDGTYMDSKEFAKVHGVSETLVRKWKSRGMIDAYNVNGHILVPVGEKPKYKNCSKK